MVLNESPVERYLKFHLLSIILFVSVAEIKNLWKKLRDGYRQALNAKKKTTGQAADSKPKWKYEYLMEFLIPHMKNRPQHTNVGTSSRNTTDTLNDDSLTGDESMVSLREFRIKKNKTIHSMLEDEQKRREKRTAERDHLRRQLMENASNQSKSETTAMEKFFLSMCDTTCQMPEYLQMRIQRQIFNIVMEAKEQHLMRSNYSDNSPCCSVYNFTGGTPFKLQNRNLPTLRPVSAQSSYTSPTHEVYNIPDAMQSPKTDSAEQYLNTLTSETDYPIQQPSLRPDSAQSSHTSPTVEVYDSQSQNTDSAEQSLNIRNYLQDFN